LAGEVQHAEKLLKSKNSEIHDLRNKMVVYETIKHKLETKSIEAVRLLKRLTELSHMNAELQENLSQVTKESIQISEINSELKAKVRSLTRAAQQETPVVQPSSPQQESGIELQTFPPPGEVVLTQGSNQDSNVSLQDELAGVGTEGSFMDTTHAYLGQLQRGLLLDEESMFGQSSRRTNYQLEDEHMLDEERSPVNSVPKRRGSGECYKSLYFEEQERARHFESMKEEYERLYHQFLEKSIKTQKEKYELQVRLRASPLWSLKRD